MPEQFMKDLLGRAISTLLEQLKSAHNRNVDRLILSVLKEKLETQDVRKVEVIMLKGVVLSKMKKFANDLTILSLLFDIASILLDLDLSQFGLYFALRNKLEIPLKPQECLLNGLKSCFFNTNELQEMREIISS